MYAMNIVYLCFLFEWEFFRIDNYPWLHSKCVCVSVYASKGLSFGFDLKLHNDWRKKLR